jgi:hypothetical protein
MNRDNAAPEYFDCPVVGCDGYFPRDHEEGSIEHNLHRQDGPAIEGLDGMRIDYIIAAATWPRWTMDVDVQFSELSPQDVHLVADALFNAAAHCDELNGHFAIAGDSATSASSAGT